MGFSQYVERGDFVLFLTAARLMRTKSVAPLVVPGMASVVVAVFQMVSLSHSFSLSFLEGGTLSPAAHYE